MRTMVAAAVACLSVVGLSVAADVQAFTKRDVSIPAGGLGPALQALSAEGSIHVVFISEDVNKLSTKGASGSLTIDEALNQLLNGTGLTFQYIDDETVSIVPLATTPAARATGTSGQRFRLAQAETPSRSPRQATAENSSENFGERATLEEIIVTAQKRSENIQDVPVSISAVSSEQLRATDASQLSDIAAAIPGLQLNSQTGQPGSVNVTLRGITTADITSTTTAITVDDVPLGSSTAYAYAALSNVDLLPYDLDHVEVLKGPQGTLYGASSLGGLVKYVTTTPDLNTFSGRVGGSMSSIDRSGKVGASGRISVNVPVVAGQFAISAGAGHSSRPGYIDNIATGEESFNDGEQDNARLTLLWRPSDQFSAKITGLYNRSDFNGVGGVAYDVATNQPTYGYFQTSYNKPFKDARKTYVFIGDLSYDFGFASLTSVTGFSDMKGVVTYDASEIPYYKANFQAIGVLTPGQFDNNTEKLSQEFRLASSDDQALQWLVGGFYVRERTRYLEYIDALFTANNQPAPAFTPFYDNDSPSQYEEEAVFANLTYNITDVWDVGGGARYSRNDQKVSANTTGYLVSGGGQSPEFRSADSSTTWALNSRYHITSDAMFYARVATGYRPGGANTAAGVPATFKPDKTTSYELGIKSDLLDRRMQFNMTAFYIDWTDIQLTDRLPNQIPFTGNAGKATSQGIELSSSYQLIEALKLAVVVAYTDAQLEADAPAVGATAGYPLPNTPDWSGLASLDWSRPLANRYVLNAGLAWRYVGSRESAFPLAQGGGAHLRAYDVLDLTAGLETGRWRANIFAKNLTNEKGFLSYSNFAATILQPRTVGLSMDFDF